MKCLITDAVYAGIAEELKKYMDVTTTDGKPLSKAEMLEKIGDSAQSVPTTSIRTMRRKKGSRYSMHPA